MEKRQYWDQEQRNPCCKGRGRKALVAHQMDKAKWCRNIYSYRYQRGGRGVQQRYSFHQIRWVLYGEAVPSHWRNVALLLVASWHSYSTAGSGDRPIVHRIRFYCQKAELCSGLWQPPMVAITHVAANLNENEGIQVSSSQHVCTNAPSSF